MAHRVLVSRDTLTHIDARVAREHRELLYRPVVSGIVESVEGDILFVEVSAGNYWSFPQGGIEKGESAVEALLRELKEEVSIQSDGLTIRKFCTGGQMDIPNWSRDGFTHGKSYYYFHVVCDDVPNVMVDYREAVAYRWVAPDDAPDLTLQLWSRRGMKEKSESMFFALKSALRA